MASPFASQPSSAEVDDGEAVLGFGGGRRALKGDSSSGATARSGVEGF